MRAQLEHGLAALGIAADADQLTRLETYAHLLLEKNQVMNLTSITAPDDVCRLHFLDSAALLGRVSPAAGTSLIDVGTGAGFPGLVLKILVPSLRLTLLDGLKKRLDWLSEVCRVLSLDGVAFVHARAEEASLLPAHRDRYDVVTARAVARLTVLTELCLPYTKPGGLFLAMKAEDYNAEAAEALQTIKTLGGRLLEPYTYQIPNANVTRRIAVIQKERPTPTGYPRRWTRIKEMN